MIQRTKKTHIANTFVLQVHLFKPHDHTGVCDNLHYRYLLFFSTTLLLVRILGKEIQIEFYQ